MFLFFSSQLDFRTENKSFFYLQEKHSNYFRYKGQKVILIYLSLIHRMKNNTCCARGIKTLYFVGNANSNQKITTLLC